MRFSRSNTNAKAKELAENIKFPIVQRDSILELQKGFAITRDDKFRNQQVLVVVEVPVGKRIELDRSLDDFEWFSINTNRRRGFNVSWDNNWDDSFSWDSNVEYIMTREGLQRTGNFTEKELKEGNFKFKIDDKGVIIEGEGELKDKDSELQYEYKGPEKKGKSDTIIIKSKTSVNPGKDTEEDTETESDTVMGKIRKFNEVDASPLMILSTVLQ